MSFLGQQIRRALNNKNFATAQQVCAGMNRQQAHYWQGKISHAMTALITDKMALALALLDEAHRLESNARFTARFRPLEEVMRRAAELRSRSRILAAEFHAERKAA